MSSHDNFDLTIPPFPAPFRRWLVSDGIIPYKFKCLSIGPFLYTLGVLVSLATHSFHKYIFDYPVLFACIVSSVALCGIIYGCKQVSPTINQLDETLEHSKDSKFKDFIFEVTNERYWCHTRYRYWYYLHTFGLAALIGAIAYLGFFQPPTWIRDVSQNTLWISNIFFILTCAVIGYIVGLGFDLTWTYAYCINKYSNEFVKAEKIELFPLEGAGGLKPIGKLALKINIASVIPVAYALAALYKAWDVDGMTLVDKPLSIISLGIYVIMLTIIFFYPMMPVHKELVKAKAKVIDHLGLIIKQKFRGVGPQDSPEKYILLNDLLSTHQRLKRIPTWPLDARLSFWSMSAILFPLIGGAILQIWFEFLIGYYVH